MVVVEVDSRATVWGSLAFVWLFLGWWGGWGEHGYWK